MRKTRAIGAPREGDHERVLRGLDLRHTALVFVAPVHADRRELAHTASETQYLRKK